jgi:dienelactone hydrolase
MKPLNTGNKCPMLFIAGAQDKQVPCAVVLAASKCFEKEGHPIDFLTHRGGHGWNHELGVNEALWRFLKDKRLAR